MSATDQDISKLSPHKLITPFAQTAIWKWTAFAVVIHIVAIIITSIGFLADRFGGGEQAAAAVQVTETTDEPGPGTAAAQPQPVTPTTGVTPTSVQPDAGGGTPTGQTPDDGQAAMMEKHKDTEVIKDITEKADPDEIPDEPDLGISIDDTKID